MKAAKRRWLLYMPAALVAAGIAVFSLMENPQGIIPATTSDKVLHGAAYCVLALTLLLGLEYKRSACFKHYLYTFLCTIAYGALMEGLQFWFTTTRTAEWGDLLADGLGALAAMAIVAIIQRINHK